MARVASKVEKGQIRIQVEAAGLNRADLLQIKGLYPGKVEIPVLGLECSGLSIRSVKG